MRIAVLLFSCTALLSAHAEPITWTNQQGGWWGAAQNWSPNVVPSSNDVAEIKQGGTYTVNLDLSPTIAGLVIGSDVGTQTLATAGQNLTLNGAGFLGPGGRLLMYGTLSGTNQVTVEGRFSWEGGLIDVGGVIDVRPAGTLEIGGGAEFSKLLLGAVTNAGVITYKPYGALVIGGTLCNLAEGLIDVQSPNRGIAVAQLPGVIINRGVLRVSPPGLPCEVPLVNSATVDVLGGTLGLTASSVFEVGSRFTGAGVTRMDFGTNVLNGAIYSENLVLNGATLKGECQLEGSLKWIAGTLGPDAALHISTNGTLEIGGGAEFGKLLLGAVTNAGVITYKPYGALVIGGTLCNLAEGLIDVQSPNRGIAVAQPPGVIINRGVLRVSPPGLPCEVPLVNSATVDVLGGTLGLTASSVFEVGSRFTGAGVTRMDFGTNVLNGAIYSENLVLNGATITGTSTWSGTVTWLAGAIDEGAGVLLVTKSELIIGGGANNARVLAGSLTNAGVISYEPPGPLGFAGSLYNLPGGLFDIRWNSGLFASGPEGRFINDGTFRKSEAAAVADCWIPFANRGTVEVLSGALHFAGPYEQAAGELVLSNGTFRSDLPLILEGGRLGGWGHVAGDVVNSGAVVSPATSGGVLTMDGRYTQHLGGSLEIMLAGTEPGVNQSQLNVAGEAELHGTIAVQLGPSYLPVPGDAFTVLTFGSRHGTFSGRNGLILLGHDRQLTTVYGPKSLSLVTVAEPDPPGVTLQLGVDGDAALISWPLEYGGGTLYACTNLAQPSWFVVPASGNRFLDRPRAKEKYFQLRIP